MLIELRQPDFVPKQVVSWYYLYGVALLALLVLPNAMDKSAWHFTRADWTGMG